MGLDVIAYSKLVAVPGAERDADGWPLDEELVCLWENPHFKGRLAGIDPAEVYRPEGESSGVSHSYSGYGDWRRQLAKLAGYESAEEVWEGKTGPFSEQINFSDCEGTIGPDVSAKLLQDYAAFAPQAEAVGGRFWQQYQAWAEVFRVAADGGAACFH